jgi:class 3 adenylate cyclase
VSEGQKLEPYGGREPAVGALPSGTVTFLFSDIEGSTAHLRRLGERWADALAEHRRLLREAFEAAGGREVDSQGDAFFAAFPRARQAVVGAAEAQRALAATAWPGDSELRVRMGLHTGEPVLGEEGYIGLDVVRAARLCAAAHGGQVLLSATTGALVAGSLPEGLGVTDLGEHHLKDLEHPERVHQLVVEGLPSSFPPPRTGRHGIERRRLPLGGREDELVRQAEDAARDLSVQIQSRIAERLRAAGIDRAAPAATAPPRRTANVAPVLAFAAFALTLIVVALVALVYLLAR